ncbi:MAG: hypothetical protein HOP96_02265, partial [Sphingomonas sp.]|nr:hypothetical protein [Sphingomonas sp.]
MPSTPTNTGGGTTVSFMNTPQAKDDYLLGLNEDFYGKSYWDVLSNDLGGNSKVLWSIDNGGTATSTMSDLLTPDARAESTSTDYSAQGAHIWICADGKVGYDASSLNSAFRAQLQALNAGQTITDSFTYAIRLGNGTLSWATATVVYTGVNDRPVLVSSIADQQVNEDNAWSFALPM